MASGAVERLFSRFSAPLGVGAVSVASKIDGALALWCSGDAGDGVTLSDDTLFNVGSIAKPLTGIVLADMALRSEIDLAAPVSEYIPGLTSVPSGSVTVDELATHRAGLPLRPPSAEANEAIVQYDGVTRQSILDDFARYTPATDRAYEYSNFGFAVLGQVLEQVTGVDWPSLVTARLLMPMGMTDTCWFYSAEVERTRVATPMGRQGQALPERDVAGLIGAGGFYSTSRDMARLMNACIEPPSGTLGDAITMAMEPRGVITSSDGNLRFTALGWQILDYVRTSTRVVWKNGHGPGNHSFFGVVVSSGLGLVALSNHHHGPEFDRDALNALLRAASR